MPYTTRHKNHLFIYDDNGDLIGLDLITDDSFVDNISVNDVVEDDYIEDIYDDMQDDNNCSTNKHNRILPLGCGFVYFVLIQLLLISIYHPALFSIEEIASYFKTSTTISTTATTTASTTSTTTTSTAPTTSTTITTSITPTTSTTTTSSITSTTAHSNRLFCSEEMLYFFAGSIFFEQNDSSKDGQFAVAHVVLNRMNGTLTEEKLMAVLTAPYQFDSVSTDIHHWDQYGMNRNNLQSFSYNGVTYYTKKATDQSLEVARLVLSGESDSPIGNCKHFRSKGYFQARRYTEFVNAKGVETIGANTFFSSY